MSAVTRNIAANYVGQAWVAGIGLVFIPIYIDHLGMESYGLVGLFAVMQSWLALLDMGMTPTLNREMARFKAGAHTPQSIRDLLNSIEIVSVGIAIAIAATVWCLSGFIAKDWLKPERLSTSVVAHALSIMALVIALRFIESLYRGSLYGLQRQVWYNVTASVLATIRHGGAALVVIWISPTIQAFFVWQGAVSILSLATLAIGVHGSLPKSPLPPRFSQTAIAGIWKFAASMLAITLLSLLLTQTDKILLSRLLPLKDFGYYALAATLAGVISLLVGPVVQSVYPRMIEVSAKKDELSLIDVYHQSAQLVTVLTAPAAVLLSCFSGGIVYMWSGNAELARNTAPLLSILVVGSFLNGLVWLPYHCQLAHGWTTLALKTNVVAVSLLIPAILWMVPRYGAVGAAWVWVALNAGYVLFSVQLMHARLLRSEKWAWYGKDLARPALGSLLVGLVAYPLHPIGYQSRWDWFLFLLLTGVSALVVSIFLANRLSTRFGQLLSTKLRNQSS